MPTIDHKDVELTLKIYDLRREPVMRASRDALNGKFWPTTFQEVEDLLKPDHPMNAAFRQVSGYWEMVYSFARHEVIDPDFLVENNGEGLFFFAKIQPYIEQLRAAASPTMLRNTEWIATHSEEGKRRFAFLRGRVEKRLADMKT